MNFARPAFLVRANLVFVGIRYKHLECKASKSSPFYTTVLTASGLCTPQRAVSARTHFHICTKGAVLWPLSLVPLPPFVIRPGALICEQSGQPASTRDCHVASRTGLPFCYVVLGYIPLQIRYVQIWSKCPQNQMKYISIQIQRICSIEVNSIECS